MHKRVNGLILLEAGALSGVELDVPFAGAALPHAQPGRRLSDTARRLLKRVACTPAAVTWMRSFTAGDAAAMLLRPDVCEWAVADAAAKGDVRTLGWLLGVGDEARALELRTRYHNLWDK